jgi:hypothetical protein
METTFGKLKAGDKFTWNGGEYEKISGNFADDISGDVLETVEIPSHTIVQLQEEY